MSKPDIIRAWRDTEYRLSLSEEQQALIPPHPAGLSAGLSGMKTPSESIPVSPFSIYYSCYWICNLDL